MTVGPRDAGEDGAVIVESHALLFARRAAAPVRSRHAWAAREEWRTLRGQAAWARGDVAFLTALFVIFILNLLDISITLIYTGAVGWVAEGNMLIRVLAESAGPLSAVVFKVVLVGGAMWVMWRLYRFTASALSTARTSGEVRRARFVLRSQFIATGLLLALYVWIVQHNARIVWL